jgi:radical SAM superfamily enzyme YgiQ (UPF0313 family)
MRVAFVFAPFTHMRFEEDVDIVSREFGTFAPLGLGYAAAIAERAGHETLLIDANAEKLSVAQVLSRLKPFKPDLLGFMLTTYMFHETMRYVTAIKKETGLPVVVGNVNMELYPRETMARPEIDYGIIGSAQRTLPALLDALAAGKPPPEMPGLCVKRGGEVVVREPESLREDFSTLPFPKRDGLPHAVYHSVMSKRKNLANMVTAKGCPNPCTFCHIHKVPYTARKPEGVVGEIQEMHDRFGVREIEIFDPSFTTSRKRVIAICEEIVSRGLDIHFACRLRIDQVDPEMLDWMARAGFKRLLYGIESGSPERLAAIRKNITLDQIRQSVKWTRERGMMSVGFFLIGSPGETRESVEQTIRFAIDLDLDYAQFHRTMAKPKTELGDLMAAHAGYDYWREWVLGHQPEMRLPAPWTDLGQDEIERLAYQAYRRFYLRPRYLFKTIAGVKSVEELARYVRSGIGLVLGKSDLT